MIKRGAYEFCGQMDVFGFDRFVRFKSVANMNDELNIELKKRFQMREQKENT